MEPSIQPHVCSNPECKVSETGVCIEGNTPIESCPFFGQESDIVLEDFEGDVDEKASDTDIRESIEPDYVSLPSGQTLVPAEVDKFLLWKPAKFITIVGEFNSGKTTLICSLYDRFLRGSFAGYLFGGSRTLVGLEQKSHHSRIDSGRTTPDTVRTSLSDGLSFFHFSLIPSDDLQSRIELMISDRAGEQYQNARNNSDVVSTLIEVKKAQHIVLLLDGESIADPTLRAGAMQTVRQSLRAFLDSGAISKSTRVQVVTTKIDLLNKNPNDTPLNVQLEQFQNRLQQDFGERLDDLSFWDIAARDPDGKFDPAHGVDALVKSWCTYTPPSVTRAQLNVVLETEFDLLLSRTRMRELP